MDPRPYQINCIEAVESGWKQFQRQLIVVPTGGGKTIIFSWLAKRQPGRTLILAHREELIDQAIEKLHRATGILAEKEKAECRASLNAQAVVASFQTMARRLDKWPQDHFALVVADEAHHAIARSQQVVLQHFDPARVLGVTATPDRGDKKNLGQYFQNTAAEISLFDLIDDGFLSRIAVKSVPLTINLSGVRQTMGDFNETDLGHALEPYLDQIAASIKEYASFRRVLAFLPLIATSQKFVAACRAAGLAAEHIDGESVDRRDKLRRFAAGEFDLLSNAMLLTEGYDDPGIDCVIVLRPTKSRPLFAQMVGRGTRIADGKDNLLLLDFLWLHERHSICRPAHLIARSEEEAEAITALTQGAALPAEIADQCEMDLQDLAGAATSQREEALRKKLAEQSKKKAKTISAEEFAIQHNALAIAEFEPVMKWEGLQITDKQASVLKRAKIDVATVRGRGHASKLIDLVYANQHLELASPGQRRIMERLGHPNPGVATAAEARRFFAELKQKEVLA